MATLGMVAGRPDPVYVKQGIYRTRAWTVDQSAWFGPLTIGTTADDVMAG